MIALDKDTLDRLVSLMEDDVPAGLGEMLWTDYGPDSAWATEGSYEGPCLHDLDWGIQCGCCPHQPACTPRPSTFEALVLDYLCATGRKAIPTKAAKGFEEWEASHTDNREIPF